MDSILQTTLAGVIKELATFFGTTTEVIMQNAPTWLAKYGWFSLMQNLPPVILLWIIMIAGLFALIIAGGYSKDWKSSTVVGLCALAMIICTLVIFGCWFLQCAVAPELYGLDAILYVIKQ